MPSQTTPLRLLIMSCGSSEPGLIIFEAPPARSPTRLPPPHCAHLDPAATPQTSLWGPQASDPPASSPCHQVLQEAQRAQQLPETAQEPSLCWVPPAAPRDTASLGATAPPGSAGQDRSSEEPAATGSSAAPVKRMRESLIPIKSLYAHEVFVLLLWRWQRVIY